MALWSSYLPEVQGHIGPRKIHVAPGVSGSHTLLALEESLGCQGRPYLLLT